MATKVMEKKVMENKPKVKSNHNRRVSKFAALNLTAELTCQQIKEQVIHLKLVMEETTEKLEAVKASRDVVVTPESIAECDKFLGEYADKLAATQKQIDVYDIYLKQRHLPNKSNRDVGLCTCQPEVSTKAPNLPVAIPEPIETQIEKNRAMAALAGSLAV